MAHASPYQQQYQKKIATLALTRPQGVAVTHIALRRDGYHSQEISNSVKNGGVGCLYQAGAYAKRVSLCLAQAERYTPGR
jgi:hypothetical protein